MARHNPQKESSLRELRNYIKSNPYIEILEQPKICNSFGLPYFKKEFENIYRRRFYDYLLIHISTVATVSKVTKIPHKYLCEVKAYYEKRDLLKVLYLGICPTTNSKNVQFVSTNKAVWSDKSLIPQSNQLELF